jgi:hypothetical protein
MAKGKHAAALFEVIHSAKDRQDKSGALSTPKWWFKNRAKPAAPGEAAPAETAATAPAQAPLAAPAAASAPAQPAAAGPIQTPARRPLSTLSRPLNSDRETDRGWNRITLRFTYANCAIILCAVAVIVGSAFVIGRHLSRGPAQANAGSIDQLRHAKPNPEVLKVGESPANTANSKPVSANPPVDAFANGNSPPAPVPVPTPSQAASATPGKRIVGMQYVVVQSYPKEADAQAAADLLIKNGIPCTVERNLAGWGPSWFCVVGATGFDHTRNNPEYAKYLQSISGVSEKFAGKIKFKQFDPMAYTWKDATR